METKQAVAALAALAQETRLAVFRLLVERGPEGLAAGAIAQKLDVPASSLSFHLAQLHHAGLITQRRESRMLIYAADYGAMNTLIGYLMENCCLDSSEACAETGGADMVAAIGAELPKAKRKSAGSAR